MILIGAQSSPTSIVSGRSCRILTGLYNLRFKFIVRVSPARQTAPSGYWAPDRISSAVPPNLRLSWRRIGFELDASKLLSWRRRRRVPFALGMSIGDSEVSGIVMVVSPKDARPRCQSAAGRVAAMWRLLSGMFLFGVRLAVMTRVSGSASETLYEISPSTMASAVGQVIRILPASLPGVDDLSCQPVS